MIETWPPPYTLRRSHKAKRVNLRLSPEKGLELILPMKAKEEAAFSFMQSRKSWIEENWHFITRAHTPKVLPEHIHLVSIDQILKIRYESVLQAKRVQILHLPDELVLYGKIDHLAIFNELKNWIMVQAERYLLKWLRELSQQTQLEFNKLTIRGQKSRWGSCTRDKNISLNYKLMFLPYKLVEYIIIHELCHTVHLDHSTRFWRLVEKYCVDHDSRRKELVAADKYLPSFL